MGEPNGLQLFISTNVSSKPTVLTKEMMDKYFADVLRISRHDYPPFRVR